jgi:hypothetical protein
MRRREAHAFKADRRGEYVQMPAQMAGWTTGKLNAVSLLIPARPAEKKPCADY